MVRGGNQGLCQGGEHFFEPQGGGTKFASQGGGKGGEQDQKIEGKLENWKIF